MEDLFSLKYGIAGICVLLTVMILIRVGEFLWRMRETKDSISDRAIKDLTKAVQENTFATQHLEQRLNHLELSMSELPKLKKDLRRFFSAIKAVAGEKWPSIRDEIMKDGFPL